jgi:hypothetical protein
MINIKVFYPEPNGSSFVDGDIEALKKFEPIINECSATYFGNIGTYSWAQDPSAEGSVWVRLTNTFKERGGVIWYSEIMSQPLTFLVQCKVSEFEGLLRTASFRARYSQAP